MKTGKSRTDKNSANGDSSWFEQTTCKDKSAEISGTGIKVLRLLLLRTGLLGICQALPARIMASRSVPGAKGFKIITSNHFWFAPCQCSNITRAMANAQHQAELSAFKDSKYVASLDFGAGYWQCPIHPTSYVVCGISTPQTNKESMYSLVCCTA